jgi:serine/threonine-protein kinase
VETFEENAVIDGKYKVTKVLGRGGMGLVVEATQPGLDTPVAIKVLLPELCNKPEIAARFAREARAANKLRSEHVARVYSVGATPEGTPFIVMERLEGSDLAEELKARVRFEPPDAANFLLQACEAIAEAHSYSIIHRDLKPANLFVTHAAVGGRPLVKVLDFGISKMKLPGDLVTTDSAAFFGTPLYMSPEQLRGAKDLDVRSDIWALGVILYEMLAGVPPFTGDTVALVCAAIIACEPAKLSTLRPDLSPELVALVHDCLSSMREARPPTVAAFAKRLAPFGGSEARLSYERIALHANSMTGSDGADLKATVPPVAETRPPRDARPAPPSDQVSTTGPVSRTGGPLVQTDSVVPPIPKGEPSPARKASSSRMPALIGLAGVAIIGGVFGVRHFQGGNTPTTASSSSPVTEAIPSASAATTPAPSASAESPTLASSASSAPAPVVSAEPVASASSPSPTTGNECAKGATKACEAACAAHSPGRCEALGRALLKGTGAPKDVARGEELLQTECTAGAGSACNSLGILYGSGNGVTADNAKAFGFYKQGCEHEDRTACVNVGAMLSDGTGVPKNPTLAATFFVRGCPSSGPVEPTGCVYLSIAYAQGKGVPADPLQAVSYAKKGCDNGAPVGCTRVSTAKLTGEGIAKDVQGALGELDAACTKGEASACKELVTVYSRGVGTDVPRDDARYRIYLDKACKTHDQFSCQLRDLVLKNDNQELNISLNTAQLEMICTAGLLNYCGFLGERLVAIPAEHAKGMTLLDKACKGGPPKGRACQKLAEAQR